MGASSVTGISGPGSAEGGFRGPGNGRNMYVSLISPHVVTAGTTTLVGGTSTVTLSDPVVGPYTNYIVMATSTGANPATVGASANDTNGNFSSFVVNGTGTQVINYAVINVGRPPAAPLL